MDLADEEQKDQPERIQSNSSFESHGCIDIYECFDSILHPWSLKIETNERFNGSDTDDRFMKRVRLTL